MDEMINYLHLNASFSDCLGLREGKSAAVLYFSCLNDPHYSETVAIAFLEELLGQVVASSPLTYGDGLAGIGTLLSYLCQSGKLDQNISEIFAEPDIQLIGTLFNDRLQEMSLSRGIAGFGTYFLFRLREGGPKEGSFQFMRYRKAIVASVDQIAHRFNHSQADHLTKYDLSIWRGWPGIYIYLIQVYMLGYPIERVVELMNRIRSLIVLQLSQESSNWHQIEAWFVLAQAHDLMEVNNYRNKFKVFLETIQNEPLDFYLSAFYALLLWLIGNRFDIPLALALGQKLERFCIDTLLSNPLNRLFPADSQTGAIPMGLERGLVGTALPLYSIKTGNAGWLEIFGVETKVFVP